MITVEEALEKILAAIRPLGAESVSLKEAAGRVLAEEVAAPRALPPWDNTAMDGYAVRREDLRTAGEEHPVTLDVSETIPAGRMPERTLQAGQASRIMTGAPVPSGATAVVMREEVDESDPQRPVFRRCPKEGEHIRREGEDIPKGAVLLSPGDPLTPARVGLLASVGRSSARVSRQPRVGILATGDEIVDVGVEAAGAQIYSSNTYSLHGQVIETGAVPVHLGIVADEREALLNAIEAGLRACDALITTGGVSVGDYDFVKEALTGLKGEMAFWKVAMKPGKPQAFGTIGGKPLFGLPGNPVSAMVSFELFARPALRKMMGHVRLHRPVWKAELTQAVRKKDTRRHYVRVRLFREGDRLLAEPAPNQSSAALSGMALAHGLAIVPESSQGYPQGATVEVMVLDCSFEEKERTPHAPSP